MSLPESTQNYANYAASVPEMIRATLSEKTGLAQAQALLEGASRIFFTGSGSSVPAALLGSQLLARTTTKAGMFAPSSLLLDEIKLSSADVVVLVSQGWNRADAALITRKVVDSPARLIVITGRPDREGDYGAQASSVVALPILPQKEKIFCRPASAVTGYIKIAQLLESLTGVRYNTEQWIDAYQAGWSRAPSALPKDKQFVVLATSLLLCAGNNIALSLREGAGRYGSVHELESYGHGQYVPDQLHIDSTHYFVLTAQANPYYRDAFARIKPMLDSTHSSYEIWDTPHGDILGNVSHMGRIAKTVLASIQQDGWDMNNPPGMEGNRSFHEADTPNQTERTDG